MYALRVYINKSVFGKKIIENRQFFQFSIKFFFKMEYYCVSLKYTLVKSFIYIHIYISSHAKRNLYITKRESENHCGGP